MKKYFLNILSLVFLVVTLTTLTAITANPEIKQLISSQAKRERDDPNAGEDGKKGQKDIESDPDARIRKAERAALSEGGDQYSVSGEQCVGFSCLQIQEGQIASDKLSKETAGIIEPGQAIDAQIVSDAFNQLAQQQASTLTEATKIQAAPIAQVTPKPLTANTSASCGVGMIAEDEVCRNSTTGAITEYKDIVLYNAAIGNFTSSLTREEKEYVINQCGSRCGSVDSPIISNIQDFSLDELDHSDTKDLFERAVDVNEAKDITGSLTDINSVVGTSELDSIFPKKATGTLCGFSSDCQSGYCGFGVGAYQTCQDSQSATSQSQGQASLELNGIITNTGSISEFQNVYNAVSEKNSQIVGLYLVATQNVTGQGFINSDSYSPFFNPETYNRQSFNQDIAKAVEINTITGYPGRLLEGRDIIAEQTKFAISEILPGKDVYYLIGPGANKEVYEENGIIYDAKSDSPIGSKDQFAGYGFIDAPKTIYAGFPDIPSNFITGYFLPHITEQHTTITQSTFQDPTLQKINSEIQLAVGENISNSDSKIEDISKITKIVNKNLEFYEPIGNTKSGTPEKSIAWSAYRIEYRTLDNLIKNDTTICFDQAVTEYLILAGQGIKSDIVSNPEIGHSYLLVYDGGETYVVDPTRSDGVIKSLEEHKEKYEYDESDYTIITPSINTLP